jgi:hypothetical protein
VWAAPTIIDFTGLDNFNVDPLVIGSYTFVATGNDTMSDPFNDDMIVDPGLTDFVYTSSSVMPNLGFVASDIVMTVSSGTFNLTQLRVLNSNDSTQTFRI